MPVRAEGDLIADRYRLRQKLGSGAMGEVWRAVDESLDRTVAVKLLSLKPGNGEQATETARQRALREGRIAARLQHPNAITVHDVTTHDGSPVLVMEYLPSQSLATVLGEHGMLPPLTVAGIGAQVAAALVAAHKVGIVHRDLKPGNILLGEDCKARITDFGISRASGEGTLTDSGIILGTPAYLAPEIVTGGDPAPAADVFSLGSTLYAAIEGEPPFGADEPLAVLHRIAGGRIKLPRRAGPMTDALTRMLQRDPADRPSMAEAQVLILQAAVAESWAKASPPSTASTPEPPITCVQPAPERTRIAASPSRNSPDTTFATADDAADPAEAASAALSGRRYAAATDTQQATPDRPPLSTQESSAPKPQARREATRGPLLRTGSAQATRRAGRDHATRAAPGDTSIDAAAGTAADTSAGARELPPITRRRRPRARHRILLVLGCMAIIVTVLVAAAAVSGYVTPSAAPREPRQPSQQELENVVRQYYKLVPEAPDLAFELLGPDLRKQGKAAHAQFWRNFTDVQIFRGPKASGTNVEITVVLTFPGGGTLVPIRMLTMTVSPDGRPLINTDRSPVDSAILRDIQKYQDLPSS